MLMGSWEFQLMKHRESSRHKTINKRGGDVTLQGVMRWYLKSLAALRFEGIL